MPAYARRRERGWSRRVTPRAGRAKPHDGLWPKVRREAVSGATRALWCRVWHEIRVNERTDR
eukprot:4355578-Prymnesium_polylepis.1